MATPQGFPPQQGGYPPQQGGYPPQQGGYPPQQGGPLPQQGGPLPQQGGPPPPQEPSAPISYDNISGYEKAAGNDSVPAGPPPPYNPAGQPQERPQEHFSEAAQITDGQAKDALIEFASQHCCYGNGPAKDLSIKDMKSSSAYHYKLESFTESRTFNWHNEPYIGQPIDGPQNGPAPGAWNIYLPQPIHFVDTVIYQEIPHTASVKMCNKCLGTGHNRCHHCHGHGDVSCTSCGGRGHVHRADGDEPCSFCHGHGHRSCTHCNGRGRVTCTPCQGHGKIKTYLRLKVCWETKMSEHVLERTDLPDELITQVNGAQMFAQEFPMVFPLTSFYEPDINQASQRLISSHANFANTSIIHRQRHNLRAVPVNEVHCTFQDTPFRFWVYGVEHRVHCPDYPQQCCCGCTIL